MQESLFSTVGAAKLLQRTLGLSTAESLWDNTVIYWAAAARAILLTNSRFGTTGNAPHIWHHASGKPSSESPW